MNGGQSSDLNNDPLTYAWTLVTTPEGSSAVLSDPTVFNPVFTADLNGDYVVELVVSDGSNDSEPAYVTISAYDGNGPPVADAGANQNVTTGTKVTLDGSGSHDPDNDPLTYTWSLIAPDGSSAVLSGANEPQVSFTADLDGMYVAALVVNDGSADSEPATVTIMASADKLSPDSQCRVGPKCRHWIFGLFEWERQPGCRQRCP